VDKIEEGHVVPTPTEHTAALLELKQGKLFVTYVILFVQFYLCDYLILNRI
jgi:hypothetical protein